MLSACSASDAPSADAHGSGGAAPNSGATTSTIADAMLAAHNQARASVMPAPAAPIAPLAWSSEIASAAQTWADGCMFKHSGGKYGENIYASAGKNTTPQDVVDSWVAEVKDYDYESNSCAATCGHYTQVVWRKSTLLGCAVSSCSNNSPFSGFEQWQFWVCNYDPPGNFNGQKPY